MYYVYILFCSDKRYYVGCCDDLKQRMERHQKGQVPATAKRLPIQLHSYHAFQDKYRSKKIFDEKTLEYKKTHAVSAAYPFPYGFIINTTSGDGDNLDCFVVTQNPLKSRDIVDVEPIGMFEQIENGQEDHKVLAVLSGENCSIDQEIQNIFRKFITEVFSHRPNHKIALGRFLGKEEALELVKKSQHL